MVTTHGNVYMLDNMGNVVSRSNGPAGWNYGKGNWVILGAATRWNAATVSSLADIAAGGIPGHGVIHDYDHGSHRVWGNERMRTLTVVD